MDERLGQALLVRARNAIGARFGVPAAAAPAHAALAAPGAVFVTLTEEGRLRGCIGSLEAWRTLEADVEANAKAAAFSDPRFPPVGREELPRLRVEVSLLAPAEPLPVADEAEAVARLRPGVDGVILECGGRRGTFLPQVWESLPEPHRFLAHLKEKAGLPADFWSPEIRLHRYEVRKWREAATS
jgi:hypothetical protein